MSDSLLLQSAQAVEVVSALSTSMADHRDLDDASLMQLASISASLQRHVATQGAVIAGEIARRSSREHGHAGLAQRSGFRGPIELLRAATGITARDASTAVRVGSLLSDAAELPDPVTGSVPVAVEPWLAPVAAALLAEQVSVQAAESIRNGLGQPAGEISTAMLADAAAQLCAEAATLDADRLLRRARQVRDELDENGIADREKVRFEQRSLKYTKLPNGMALLSWKLNPEAAAICGGLFDRATSPRRGGPRFIDENRRELAEEIFTDERTTEQLASDVFLSLLQNGAAADPSRLLGSGAAVVRVIVMEETLEGRGSRSGMAPFAAEAGSAGKAGSAENAGHGWLEGQADPISLESVERLGCSGGIQSIIFDDNLQPLDVGREQRLFTSSQKVALAVRDGGCMIPGCDHPPSFTEAHHLKHWARDRGRTDISNGILLCRFHHLLLHNNHWDIARKDGRFWLIPPADVDPTQTPRPMPSKSRAIQQAARQQAALQQTALQQTASSSD